MSVRLLATWAILFTLLSFGYASDKKATKTPLPSQGVVADEATAVKIAEAVFPPVFGTEEVSKYSPYHATLKDGVWTVYGTLKPNARGGTPMMTIQKTDGRVTEMWHSQ
jgi:NTF2 fold immunity protein